MKVEVWEMASGDRDIYLSFDRCVVVEICLGVYVQ